MLSASEFSQRLQLVRRLAPHNNAEARMRTGRALHDLYRHFVSARGWVTTITFESATADGPLAARLSAQMAMAQTRRTYVDPSSSSSSVPAACERRSGIFVFLTVAISRTHQPRSKRTTGVINKTSQGDRVACLAAHTAAFSPALVPESGQTTDALDAPSSSPHGAIGERIHDDDNDEWIELLDEPKSAVVDDIESIAIGLPASKTGRYKTFKAFCAGEIKTWTLSALKSMVKEVLAADLFYETIRAAGVAGEQDLAVLSRVTPTAYRCFMAPMTDWTRRDGSAVGGGSGASSRGKKNEGDKLVGKWLGWSRDRLNAWIQGEERCEVRQFMISVWDGAMSQCHGKRRPDGSLKLERIHIVRACEDERKSRAEQGKAPPIRSRKTVSSPSVSVPQAPDRPTPSLRVSSPSRGFLPHESDKNDDANGSSSPRPPPTPHLPAIDESRRPTTLPLSIGGCFAPNHPTLPDCGAAYRGRDGITTTRASVTNAEAETATLASAHGRWRTDENLSCEDDNYGGEPVVGGGVGHDHDQRIHRRRRRDHDVSATCMGECPTKLDDTSATALQTHGARWCDGETRTRTRTRKRARCDDGDDHGAIHANATTTATTATASTHDGNDTRAATHVDAPRHGDDKVLKNCMAMLDMLSTCIPEDAVEKWIAKRSSPSSTAHGGRQRRRDALDP